MLKRKIETYLSEWKRSENRKPLVIKGIRQCGKTSIPKQLAKGNKKFQYSIVKKGGRASQYIGSLQWLEDAAIVDRC